MGKTNPTHRDQINTLEDQWGKYQRMPRRRHKPAYDQLWTHARSHADAGGARNPPNPMESVLLSICLEQQLAINEL